MYSHPDSPLQTGEIPPEDYAAHAQMVQQKINETDGVTVRETPGSEPLPVGKKTMYGVGGAKDVDTGSRYPEKVTSASPHEALAHVLDVERGNINRQKVGWPAAYVGGWREKGETVLDATSVTRSKRQAMRLAYRRGERAIFDFKNIEELPTQLDPRDVGKVKKDPGVS